MLLNKIKNRQLTYAELARKTGIGENRLKNLFTGRTQMTLREKDFLLRALGDDGILQLLSDIQVIVQQKPRSLDKERRKMPPEARVVISLLIRVFKDK